MLFKIHYVTITMEFVVFHVKPSKKVRNRSFFVFLVSVLNTLSMFFFLFYKKLREFFYLIRTEGQMNAF